jgi:hypothetical protein
VEEPAAISREYCGFLLRIRKFLRLQGWFRWQIYQVLCKVNGWIARCVH